MGRRFAILLLLSGCSTEQIAPSVKCFTSGAGSASDRILVFGESWAANGRVIPSLPVTLASRHHSTARVCSIGYSGANTAKQVAELGRQWDTGTFAKLLGGPPTAVVILTGVNDLIQHRGASNYSKQMGALVHSQSWGGAQMYTVEIPDVNMNPPITFYAKSKAFFLRYINDAGNEHPIMAYRAALRDAHLPLHIIKYTRFSKGFVSEPGRYSPDGIHLTPSEFQSYGAYIAQNLK